MEIWVILRLYQKVCQYQGRLQTLRDKKTGISHIIQKNRRRKKAQIKILQILDTWQQPQGNIVFVQLYPTSAQKYDLPSVHKIWNKINYTKFKLGTKLHRIQTFPRLLKARLQFLPDQDKKGVPTWIDFSKKVYIVSHRKSYR